MTEQRLQRQKSLKKTGSCVWNKRYNISDLKVLRSYDLVQCRWYPTDQHQTEAYFKI